MAIAPREWRPRITRPPVHIVRFGPKMFSTGFGEHLIERVPVRIYDPAKTIADLFSMLTASDVGTARKWV